MTEQELGEMSDEEIIEVVSVLKANDKMMKDGGISDNLWGKAIECIMFLQSENAELRARLDKAVEIPDYVFECINGKVERIFTEYLTVGELKNLEANGYSLTKEAAEARLVKIKK